MTTETASAEALGDDALRGALIAAARSMMARDGKISLQRLYTESGSGRAGFYRCFSGKDALLAALAGENVKALDALTAVMAPEVEKQSEKLAVNQAGGQAAVRLVAQGGGAPAAAPVDAWLERRLRVFERALASLESRQEKAEQDLARSVSLLEQKLMSPIAIAALKSAWPDEPERRKSARGDETSISDKTGIPEKIGTLKKPGTPEKNLTPEKNSAPVPLMAAVPEEAPQEAKPAVAMPQLPPEEPISEQEVEDFIAHARAAAQRAVISPPAPQSRALPRWVAWMGVAAVTLLICAAGLALGNVARATQAPLPGATAYRRMPQDAQGRLMALADSGDARAQTLLALTYLRGGAENNPAALRWSKAAAQQGEPVAEYVLGALLSKQDAPRAFALFQDAALHGNIKAMHNLAIAYAQGQGTVEDDRRAAAWFGRAAAQGYVDSQFDLAVLFERGQGVKQNRIAALKWYLIAAAKGDGPAQARADQLHSQMTDADAAKAVEQAAAWRPQPRDALANAVASP